MCYNNSGFFEKSHLWIEVSSALMVILQVEINGSNNERKSEKYGSSVNELITRIWCSLWTSN